jgi:hypothetical protein
MQNKDDGVRARDGHLFEEMCGRPRKAAKRSHPITSTSRETSPEAFATGPPRSPLEISVAYVQLHDHDEKVAAEFDMQLGEMDDAEEPFVESVCSSTQNAILAALETFSVEVSQAMPQERPNFGRPIVLADSWREEFEIPAPQSAIIAAGFELHYDERTNGDDLLIRRRRGRNPAHFRMVGARNPLIPTAMNTRIESSLA